MIDLGTRKPIDKTAGIVIQKGEHKPNVLKKENYFLYVLKPIIQQKKINLPKRINRLEIIGYADRLKMGLKPRTANNKKGNIVVRCDCGNYELKTRKYLLKITDENKMCSECSDNEAKKRKLFYKDHGFYPNE